jgi:hypothetical protein
MKVTPLTTSNDAPEVRRRTIVARRKARGAPSPSEALMVDSAAVRRLLKAFACMAAVLLGLLAVDVYLLLSPEQVEVRLRQFLRRILTTPFELREISVSLRSGLRVRGFIVYGPEGERAVAVDEATVTIDWRRLSIGEVRIYWPELDIRSTEDPHGAWLVTVLAVLPSGTELRANKSISVR